MLNYRRSHTHTHTHTHEWCGLTCWDRESNPKSRASKPDALLTEPQTCGVGGCRGRSSSLRPSGGSAATCGVCAPPPSHSRTRPGGTAAAAAPSCVGTPGCRCGTQHQSRTLRSCGPRVHHPHHPGAAAAWRCSGSCRKNRVRNRKLKASGSGCPRPTRASAGSW